MPLKRQSVTNIVYVNSNNNSQQLYVQSGYVLPRASVSKTH